MAEDKPDFIERAETVSKNWTGEAFTDDRLIEEFHLYGHAKRAAALDQFDEDLATADPSNLNRFVRLTSLRRNLDHVHHRLRKAGR
jgi:hypothetical protein